MADFQSADGGNAAKPDAATQLEIYRRMPLIMLKASVKRLGRPFALVPFSPVLEQLYIVSAKDIAAAARETLGALVGAA